MPEECCPWSACTFVRPLAPSAQFLCLSSSLSYKHEDMMWDKLPLCHHNMQWTNPIQEFGLKNVMSHKTTSPLDCSMTWHLHMTATCIQHRLIHDINLLALGYNLVLIQKFKNSYSSQSSSIFHVLYFELWNFFGREVMHSKIPCSIGFEGWKIH
jgi:hypothetical protein